MNLLKIVAIFSFLFIFWGGYIWRKINNIDKILVAKLYPYMYGLLSNCCVYLPSWVKQYINKLVFYNMISITSIRILKIDRSARNFEFLLENNNYVYYICILLCNSLFHLFSKSLRAKWEFFLCCIVKNFFFLMSYRK